MRDIVVAGDLAHGLAVDVAPAKSPHVDLLMQPLASPRAGIASASAFAGNGKAMRSARSCSESPIALMEKT